MYSCISNESCVECCCVVLFSFVGATLSSCAKVVRNVGRGEFECLHSLADKYNETVGTIVGHLQRKCSRKENMLDSLITTAQSSLEVYRDPNARSENINNAKTVKQLFDLMSIKRNWVDISLLEKLVNVSESKSAGRCLSTYRTLHTRKITKALAQLVDPSTDGTCPRPGANSCIIQLVFSDKRECMLVEDVLAVKDFLSRRFGVDLHHIRYISTVIGNSLVVTWLVSRHTGWRIVNQCSSPPVLAALQEMEVIAVRFRYPGKLIEVEVDVSADI